MAARFIFKLALFWTAESMLIAGHDAQIVLKGGRVDVYHDVFGSDGSHQHAYNAGLLIGSHGLAVLESHGDHHHCQEGE